MLEMGTDRVKLMNKIVNADDNVLSKCLLNDDVVCQEGSAIVLLAVTMLVYHFPDTLQVGDIVTQ